MANRGALAAPGTAAFLRKITNVDPTQQIMLSITREILTNNRDTTAEVKYFRGRIEIKVEHDTVTVENRFGDRPSLAKYTPAVVGYVHNAELAAAIRSVKTVYNVADNGTFAVDVSRKPRDILSRALGLLHLFHPDLLGKKSDGSFDCSVLVTEANLRAATNPYVVAGFLEEPLAAAVGGYPRLGLCDSVPMRDCDWEAYQRLVFVVNDVMKNEDE